MKSGAAAHVIGQGGQIVLQRLLVDRDYLAADPPLEIDDQWGPQVNR